MEQQDGAFPVPENAPPVLIDAATIAGRVRELAAEIDRDYAGRTPLLVAPLKGSFVFVADLCRALTIPHEIDFMAVAAYGDRTEHSGAVRLLKDLGEDIEGRSVLVIEDIIDSGRTADYILRMLAARNPRTLDVVTLLDKRQRREVEVPIRHTGFAIEDRFVVGYGLDYAERYRGLPYLGVLETGD